MAVLSPTTVNKENWDLLPLHDKAEVANKSIPLGTGTAFQSLSALSVLDDQLAKAITA